MKLSDDELWKNEYNEYDADGKFDHFKMYDIESCGFNMRVINVLKAEGIKTLYDLTACTTDSLINFRNFGIDSVENVQSILTEKKAFIFGVPEKKTYIHYAGKETKLREAASNLPNFKELVRQGQLDTYLDKSKTMVDEHDSNWRKKLGLPERTIEKIASSKQNPKEEFIIDYIAKSVNRIGRSFETPLDKVHPLFGGDTIKELNGKTNAEGDTLDFLGDLVLAGRQNLIESFGVNEEQIAVLDQTLPKYRLSLDMRAEAEAIYNQEITNADQPTASDDAQRKNKKKAYFKTHFTAP